MAIPDDAERRRRSETVRQMLEQKAQILKGKRSAKGVAGETAAADGEVAGGREVEGDHTEETQ